MTDLLNKVFKEVEKLPKDVQNELAVQLLDDIKSELRWQKTLSSNQKKLDILAREALEEYESGNTRKIGFDEL